MDANFAPATVNATEKSMPNSQVNCTLIAFEIASLRDPFRYYRDIRTVVIFGYILVSLIGAFGNLLVMAAVIQNRQMRTPRNYFIINLASSDFLLCVITLPFTLWSVLDHFWPFGEPLCKIISALQAINVFVSTLCITAIGLDRFLVLLFPTNSQLQSLAILGCFVSIWGISILLAVPMIFFATIIYPFAGAPEAIACGLEGIEMCREIQGWGQLRRAYSLSCFLFQYCLPLITLLVTYSKVLRQLHSRLKFRKRAVATDRSREEEHRTFRANLLIILIVVIFAIVWLPLNLYNTITNFVQINVLPGAFAFCHMSAMLSACANPILYGVLNYNFQQEFVILLRLKQIRRAWLRCKACLRRKNPYRTEMRIAQRDSMTTVGYTNGISTYPMMNTTQATLVTCDPLSPETQPLKSVLSPSPENQPRKSIPSPTPEALPRKSSLAPTESWNFRQTPDKEPELMENKSLIEQILEQNSDYASSV